MSRSFPRHPVDDIATLPVPDDVAQAHSARVVARVRAAIEAAGRPLTFSQYMDLVLYAPGLGYYSAGARKFGAGGDFVTAPELAGVFGQCLARQCAQVLATTGGDILEFGAGSGVLAADILQELAQLGSLPARYLILEVSADLRERQRATVTTRLGPLADRVVWLEQLPPGDFRGVMLANEVLDAMPVERFRVTATGLQTEFVACVDDKLCAGFGDSTDTVLASAVVALDCELPVGYESDINLRLGPWFASLRQSLAQGVVLLIDYGYSRSEYYHPQRNAGTLMCHYRHRAHSDPLFWPGLQDITAHVDFTGVAEAATRAGLALAGYTTQANFLLGCGLDQIIAVSDPEATQEHLQLTQAVKRLTLPDEMGERFKAIAFTLGVDEPLRGFSLRDLRDRL